MADVEQTPGECNIVLVQGDDINLQFSQDTNFSGYSFVTTVHPLNAVNPVTVQTVLSSGTSTSTVQINITASQSTSLDVTGDDGEHNWKIVYTDTSSKTRTWIKGKLTILTGI